MRQHQEQPQVSGAHPLQCKVNAREPGEVGQIMKQACLQSGIIEDRIHLADSPLAGVDCALQRMGAGDLGLFLVLSQRDEIIQLLKLG